MGIARMARWAAPTAVAILLAGGVPAFAAGQAPPPRPARPADASAQAEYWGAYFGNGRGVDQDVTLSPATVSLPAPVVQVATSNSTEYALLTDGTVWAWGQGTHGQLGDGGTVNSFGTAVQVQFPAGVQIAYLPANTMPFDTALAVDTDGNAWGWGFNRDGELCLGNDTLYTTPVQLPLRDVSTLAGAGAHAVYDAAGTVVSCGSGTQGELGDGKKNSSKHPVPVTGLNGQDVIQLDSAYENGGALLADGTYYDWGYDAQGQLGNGTVNQPSDVPVPVSLPDPSPISQVVQGGSQPGNGQSFALLADGSLYAWGNDWTSQLGDGGGGKHAKPVLITPPAGVTYTLLATGGNTSYGVTSDGDLYAWGDNQKGEIGNGTTTRSRVPVLVATGVTLISATANDVTVAGDSG